jgi:hypothetical protein
MEYVIGAVVGMVVMDTMWAFKLGIPQAMYYRWKHRNDPAPVYNYEGDEQ